MTSRIRWSSKVTSMFLFSLAVLQPVLAQAQEPAHTLQGLSSSLSVGDTVQVGGPDGTSVQGKVESVSTSTLKVRIGKKSQEFREPEIREIRKQFNDSLGNGIMKGAIIGVISGAVVGAVISDALCDGCGNFQGGGAAIIGIMGLGIGAGAGALGDFLNMSYKTVFTTPKVAEKRFDVSPILSKQTKGVSLAFRF